MQRSMARLAIAALFGVGALPAAPVGAQEPGLERLAFMAGCWAQEGDGLREQFTAPTANMVLGMSRFVVGGEAVQFEFHRILAAESGPVLTPHPNGVASVPFAASTSEEAYVVFENPEHDFPQRILYDGRRPDTLVAAIEGERDGRTVRREWPMIRVACGAGSP